MSHDSMGFAIEKVQSTGNKMFGFVKEEIVLGITI
jgi:hypothetical protein